MKKIMNKSLSILLAVITLFAAIPMLVSAEAAEAPEFTVKKISETEESLVLALSLKSGSFLCFDACLTVKDLECTMAITTDEFDDFVKSIKRQGENAADCENAENGKVSVSVTESCVAPMDIVEYTFKKNEKTGVNGSDVSLVFDFCYVDDGENGELNVTENITTEVALPATHVHATDGEWITVTEATCAAKGFEELYCTECGELADARDIPAKEHANTREVSQEATCTADGFKDVYCDDCEQRISHEVIPATGHVNTREDRVEATCTTDGYVDVYCVKCSERLSHTVLPAINHAHTHVEDAEATCTAEGYHRVVCDDCKEVLSETIYPAKGHGETKQVRREATCTVDGAIDTVCVDCNEVLSSIVIPATGHPSYRIEQKAATCTEDGYVKYYCEKCHELVKNNVIKSTGHKKVTVTTDATCHETGSKVTSCTVCHEVFETVVIPKTTHKWGEWKTVKEATTHSDGLMRRTCKICGDYDEKIIPSLYVKPTGIKISTNEISMNYKKTSNLYADLMPAEAAFSNEVKWESSNTRVATVDENGIVTAKGIGTATITASTPDGKFTDTCKVTVTYSWIQLIIVYVLFGWIWY